MTSKRSLRDTRRSLALLFSLILMTSVFNGSMAWGQGMAQGAPPPPGVKVRKCKGRTIPQLQDVTDKSGIHFRHVFAPEAKYIPESMSGGVLLLDYDRDGWIDIYFTNAPTLQMFLKGEKASGALYHNNGDGTFADVTAKAGIGAPCWAMGGSVADYNNDGWPDIYVTCLDANALYRNNGDGTFTDVAAKSGVVDNRWSMGSSFGDYDNDGYVDLMVTNYVDFDPRNPPTVKGSTCKFRGVDVQCGPRGLQGAGDSLFHNNGDGTFTNLSKAAGVDDPNKYYGLTTVWADLNNTGRPDIFVANDSTPNFLYRNDGKGKFTEIAMESGLALSEDGFEQASMGVALGDYLHTGRESILTSVFANDYEALRRNDGKWIFEDVSYASGIALPSYPWVKWGDAFVDLDNDTWLDAVIVNGHVYPQVDKLPQTSGLQLHQPKFVYFNQGDGSFCDASEQSGQAIVEPRLSRGLAVGDLFNDGNMDIVVEDLDSGPMILRNPGIPGHHWISFELAGTKSNRMAIGAKVSISAGGVTQMAEIHSGGSYLSQHDVRVHFGLNSSVMVEKIQIRWPSGTVDNITNLPADKFYAVLEGKGTVDFREIRPSRSTAAVGEQKTSERK